MGSWYGTCGLTQMPLISDEIVMIPIKSISTSQDGSDYCNPDDYWEICGVPIFGKYNDYGCIAEHPGQDQIHLFNASIMRKKLVPFESVNNRDSVTVDSIMDFEQWQSAIHDDHLHMNDHDYINGGYIGRPVGRMFILRRVWDGLVNEFPKPDYRGAARDKSVFLAEIEQQVISPQTRSFINSRLLDGRLLTIVGDLADYHVHTMVNGKMDPVITLVMNQMAELAIVNNAMHEMRKAYMPQCGAGSQSNDHRPYAILIKAMQQAMQDYKDEYGEDDEDDLADAESTT